MSEIPELERELVAAAGRLHARGRKLALNPRAVASVLALIIAIGAAVAIGSGVDLVGDQAEAGGIEPELRETLAVFSRAGTPADEIPGDPERDLDASRDRQPGEVRGQSRRIDLPTGPVYLWPMRGGVCSSWGNCVPVSYVREHGVALSTEVAVGQGGSYTKVQLAGIVRDGIGEVRFSLADGDQVAVPVRDNVFWVDLTGRARPTEMHWDDAGGTHTRPTGIVPASALLREFELPSR